MRCRIQSREINNNACTDMINKAIDFSKPFRDPARAGKLLEMIHTEATGSYRFMEVCGGHTASVHKYGIKELLPGNIRLISGPGCPVCVSSGSFIDHAIALSRTADTITASFGDLLRVPGRGKKHLMRPKAGERISG
jgi:hydrogenase expression/formation protein HypD